MRKVLGATILGVAVLLLAWPVPSEARGPRVFFDIGIPFGVAPAPWWGPPYAYAYPAPPVIVQPPPVYEQAAPPAPSPTYWYYCPNPQGYYPYISQCPSGWMRVVPPSSPPGQ